ncbi:hypothetical protein, partial [Alishewanella longhuensis]|uniref:hypothetical protein n=1 Tax=Alishewanella longhuensis TaxID=1091037 RepID=UPI001E4634F4
LLITCVDHLSPKLWCHFDVVSIGDTKRAIENKLLSADVSSNGQQYMNFFVLCHLATHISCYQLLIFYAELTKRRRVGAFCVVE